MTRFQGTIIIAQLMVIALLLTVVCLRLDDLVDKPSQPADVVVDDYTDHSDCWPYWYRGKGIVTHECLYPRW